MMSYPVFTDHRTYNKPVKEMFVPYSVSQCMHRREQLCMWHTNSALSPFPSRMTISYSQSHSLLQRYTCCK